MYSHCLESKIKVSAGLHPLSSSKGSVGRGGFFQLLVASSNP